MLSKQNSSVIAYIVAQEMLPAVQALWRGQLLQKVCTNHYDTENQNKNNIVCQIGSF